VAASRLAPRSRRSIGSGASAAATRAGAPARVPATTLDRHAGHVTRSAIARDERVTPVAPVAPPAVDRFLREARTLWLSTVHEDGRPHLVPIWFTWDGTAFLLFSKPWARKIDNIRRTPDVMVAVGDPASDFDVQLIEGRAELLPAPTADVMPPHHLDRYEAELSTAGLDRRAYADLYSQAVRIVPTRFLPWHGRGDVAHVSEANRPERSAA